MKKNNLANIKSVILIDDNSIDNYINQAVLHHYGIDDVKNFTSSTAALSFLRNSNEEYPLILLDIHMPQSDGFDFIEKFHEFETDLTKIIILSSFMSPIDIEMALSKKIKFIEKPLTIEKLVEVF